MVQVLRQVLHMADKILVVEDDEGNLVALSRYLQMMGYAVEQASDGAEALLKLELDRFDLVLSDIMMPVVDGYLLTKHIRANFPATPIILMTGNPPERPREVATQVGARLLLSKPFMLDELVEKIKEVLSLKEF